VSREPDRSGNWVCNGVADEVQINAAIVEANRRGGGSIQVLEGTFTLTASVDLLSNVSLLGCGDGTILTIPAGTDHCVEVNTRTNWKIGFLLARTTGAGAGNAVHLIEGTKGSIFELTIDDCGNDGIYIDANSIDVRIYSCLIHYAIAGYGINLLGDDNQIFGNRIGDTGNDGMWIQANAKNNIIAHNRISSWTGEAIDVDDLDNEIVHNVEVA